MATGLYRTNEGWVMVHYGKSNFLVSRSLYEWNGYLPSYDQLPSEDAYKAAQDSGKNDPKDSGG